METMANVLILSSSIFIFFTIPTQSVHSCKPGSCDSTNRPEVRFPFRLKDRQPAQCGFPGFDLYCNSRKQTIINLPLSGEFIVDSIDYRTQSISIYDPGLCLPNRALNFTLSGSPFDGLYMRNYVYLNCSVRWMAYVGSGDYVPLLCLSTRNSTVLAMDSRSPGIQVPPTCRWMANVTVPSRWSLTQFYWWSLGLKENLELVWSEPACRRCENQGGVCGYTGESGLEIGCSKHSGLPQSAIYAIIVGVGIPGLTCIIGLACYTYGMIKTLRLQRRLNSELSTTTISSQMPAIRAIGGLDGPTIESYPKTILGESGQLPIPSDGTCSICLCEYQPKETLRSIPECNHYYHASCIDEWLKLNGTCPLCRNSPPRPSTSISFPSSSTTLDQP